MKWIVVFACVWVCVFVAVGQEPANKDKCGIQIVNATCVSEIALSVDKKPVYPKFPQGLYTGDAFVPYTSATYRAEYTAKKLSSKEVSMSFIPNEKQTLLITGDYSITDPPDELPQPPTPGAPAVAPKVYEPNVQFRVLSHVLTGTEEKLRYRFFNGIPRKALSVRKLKEQSGQEVLPGKSFSFSKQSTEETYIVSVDGSETSVVIRQEGILRNCTIVFYLKGNQPAFSRIFENTAESEKQIADHD